MRMSDDPLDFVMLLLFVECIARPLIESKSSFLLLFAGDFSTPGAQDCLVAVRMGA
jgi:hypothetical protein